MLETRKPRVLVVGDAVAPTGFARVVREIFQPLVAAPEAQSWEIHQLGTNYFGDPHDWPWPVYPAATGGYNTGAHRLAGLVQKLQPDLVFAINDPWVLAEYLDALEPFEDVKKVLYCAFNTGPIDPEVLPKLSRCDRFVVYTEFIRKAMHEALEQARDQPTSKEDGGHFDFPKKFPDVEVMPHGVDLTTFHPLASDRRDAKQQAREALFAGHPELQDGFIVLNSNRNQPRKRIDITMAGFAHFVADLPESDARRVFLHLHMGLKDLGWDIRQLGRRLGIDRHLILTGLHSGPPHVDDAQLNAIFNAADIGINTATSEGWGLVSLEQGAAGLAQMVPDHTSGRELWHGAAELLRPALSLTDPATLCTEQLIDPLTVAASLRDLYDHPERLRELEEAAVRVSSRSKYRWDQIAGQWQDLFLATLNVEPAPARC